jgi:hypothetical protein
MKPLASIKEDDETFASIKEDDETLPASPSSFASTSARSFDSENVKQTCSVMEVTISVLSLDGVVAKNTGSKNKPKISGGILSISGHGKRRTDDDSVLSNSMTTTTEKATVVASFSHSVSKGSVVFTHVPSLPVELKSVSTEQLIKPVAYWPCAVDVDDPGQALSTLKFKRLFKSDGKSPKRRFSPQMCPINLSISRNGHLTKIGRANVMIGGDETGESSLAVPIESTFKPTKSKVPSMLNKGKDSSVPMMKFKGDNYSFGLDDGAMLRVLVSVNNPTDKLQNEAETKVEKELPVEEVVERSLQLSDAKTESNSSEDIEFSSDDESSVEHDDWETYMHEHNELRTLRQQLAKSEQANKILQLEIAVSRDALMVQNKKYDDFCAEIKQVNADHSLAIESLQRELHVAKCESDMLPMYEERINALLDELKSKDTEIKWLNDEIAEVRDYFK